MAGYTLNGVHVDLTVLDLEETLQNTSTGRQPLRCRDDQEESAKSSLAFTEHELIEPDINRDWSLRTEAGPLTVLQVARGTTGSSSTTSPSKDPIKAIVLTVDLAGLHSQIHITDYQAVKIEVFYNGQFADTRRASLIIHCLGGCQKTWFSTFLEDVSLSIKDDPPGPHKEQWSQVKTKPGKEPALYGVNQRMMRSESASMLARIIKQPEPVIDCAGISHLGRMGIIDVVITAGSSRTMSLPMLCSSPPRMLDDRYGYHNYQADSTEESSPELGAIEVPRTSRTRQRRQRAYTSPMSEAYQTAPTHRSRRQSPARGRTTQQADQSNLQPYRMTSDEDDSMFFTPIHTSRQRVDVAATATSFQVSYQDDDVFSSPDSQTRSPKPSEMFLSPTRSAPAPPSWSGKDNGSWRRTSPPRRRAPQPDWLPSRKSRARIFTYASPDMFEAEHANEDKWQRKGMTRPVERIREKEFEDEKSVCGFRLFMRGYLFHHDPTKDDARCAAYPDPGNIAVAVKTSAAQASLEELNRVATIFHCLRSDRLVFFSDLEQTLGSYHLHDVVSDVSPDLLKLHHDFTLYRQQKKLAKSGLSVRDIQQTPVLSSDMPVDQEEASKNLDKYKFLHMVEKMWEMQPDKEWYVFADASAYYVWPGLVRYLKEQDPTRPRFLSKATRIGQSELDIPHGETGFILSGVAVRALVDSGKSIAAEWDKKMPFMESGHHAVATAINAELNLTLSNTWPVMIGDSPGAIPFQTNIWCEPVVALSNISSDLALRILAKEQSYKYTSPRDFLTFRDIFFELGEINPGTIRTISNPDLSYMLVNKWDNLADVPDREWSIDWRDTATQDKGLIADMPDDPNHTADDCARACNAFRDCMQFSHMSFDARFYIDDKVLSEGGLCYLSRLYRFGSYRPLNQWEDDGNNGNNAPNSVLNTQVWTSGWIHKRWEAFSGKLTQACSATM
ncbi:Hypothetical protein D9617_1g079530 [Elsinoe fawcettii]|nr:Hypothetical protein D9617_1g079530 [Elsinoe fawcettii]